MVNVLCRNSLKFFGVMLLVICWSACPVSGQAQKIATEGDNAHSGHAVSDKKHAAGSTYSHDVEGKHAPKHTSGDSQHSAHNMSKAMDAEKGGHSHAGSHAAGMEHGAMASGSSTNHANHSDHADHQSAQASSNDVDHVDHSAMTQNTDGTKEHSAHMQHGDSAPTDLNGHVHKESPEDKKLAGVDEKLGNIVPEGIMFRNEHGEKVDVRTLMDRPTLIVPVYYNCPTVCNLLLSSVAKVLPQVSMDPKEEFRVLAVSFDAYDTPEGAARKQQQYIAATNDVFPAESWSFLTGSQESIDRFLDAIGYRVTRIDRDFVHPVALVVAAPDGKVVRYLYGNRFLPFDVTLALTEAQEGKVGLSLKRVVAYCFSYDPEGKKYVFNVMRVAGASVLSGALLLFFVLTRGGRRKSGRKNDSDTSAR